MKKNKKGRFAEAVGDIVAELILTAVFIGIGVWVFKLLGLEIDWEQTDFDLLALAGIGVIVAVVLVFALVWYILKRIKRGHNSDSASEDEIENR